MQEVRDQLVAGASADLAASRGEYLCSRLLSTDLKGTFVDAAEIIRLNGNDSVDESTYELTANRLTKPGLYVIPGFYGATLTGEVKTFSRGGSDITGALVSRAVQAEMYENWTDVSGLLMADPQIVSNPRPMAEVTYREIRELSFMGAKVFHEEAILPVYKQRIPINIRNTNKPEDPGTMIQAERDAGFQSIVGVTGRNGLELLYLEKFLLLKEPHYRSKIFEILKDQGVDWQWERAGIDSIAVVLSEGQLADKQELLTNIIEEELQPDYLEILRNMSIVAVVGEGISEQPGFVAGLLLLLSQKRIKIRLIDEGSSKITVHFLVHSKDFQRAVKTIYSAIG
jgi:aspartate kinase